MTLLFITARKNVIYIRSATPRFCTYIFAVGKYYRSAFRARINVSIILGHSRARLQEHEFLVLGGIHSCGTSIVRRGLFSPFPSPPTPRLRCGEGGGGTNVRRSKIRNPPAAAQSVSIKANGFRRYSAFYQEHRICIVRSAGLRASPLFRAGKNWWRRITSGSISWR